MKSVKEMDTCLLRHTCEDQRNMCVWRGVGLLGEGWKVDGGLYRGFGWWEGLD